MTRLRELGLIGLGAVLVAGCGGGGSGGGGSAEGPTASDTATTTAVDFAALEGVTYESTTVEGHKLVAGTTVSLGFEDGSMSVSAGCNTMFGEYAVTDGTLAWTGQPASTMMMCSSELSAQDAWLTDLFTSGVEATMEGSTLSLSSGAVTVALTPASAADPTTLLGRTWIVLGTTADGAAAPLPVDSRRPRLTVGSDGDGRLYTGCNRGRTTVGVEGDQITFGPTAVTKARCMGQARLTEEAVLAVVGDTTTDHVELHDDVLVVTVGDSGLVFRIR